MAIASDDGVTFAGFRLDPDTESVWRDREEMQPLVAHCHLGLGRLYRHTGERERAGKHLATATTMYCEMDMRWRGPSSARQLDGGAS